MTQQAKGELDISLGKVPLLEVDGGDPGDIHQLEVLLTSQAGCKTPREPKP